MLPMLEPVTNCPKGWEASQQQAAHTWPSISWGCCRAGGAVEAGTPRTLTLDHPVAEAPQQAALEARWQLTAAPLEAPGLRVVTYNILADQYAATEKARTVLFSYCPQEYAPGHSHRQGTVPLVRLVLWAWEGVGLPLWACSCRQGWWLRMRSSSAMIGCMYQQQQHACQFPDRQMTVSEHTTYQQDTKADNVLLTGCRTACMYHAVYRSWRIARNNQSMFLPCCKSAHDPLDPDWPDCQLHACLATLGEPRDGWTRLH